MASKTVEINISGKKKNLKMGYNALIELEELIGKPLASLSEETPTLSDMRTMFYVALKNGGDKKVTLEMTGDFIDEVIDQEGMEYLSTILAEVLQASLGKGGNVTQLPSE